MKQEYMDAIKYGKVIKHQTFLTDRGGYQIVLVRYKNSVYFYKYLNGKIVECCNLNRKKSEKEKEKEV